MEQPILARFIIEILGAPKEYIVKALRDHIDKLKDEGLDIQYEKYEEPVEKDKLFSQFVEVQISFKKLKDLLDFCFDSMPSSVEIIRPERLELDMAQFEDFMNDFQAKLHHADMTLKGLQAQKQVLDRNAINVFHNFIKYACAMSPKTLDELSTLVGVGSKELNPFVENLVQKGTLKKEGNSYTAHG